MSRTRRLRSVAVPTEHGGWSLTLEPVLLGLLVAGSSAGVALGAAALVLFVVRTPLKVVLVDRWRGRWVARTSTALVVATVESVVFGVLVALAIAASRGAFWWPLAAAAPLVGIELWYDMRSRSRRLVAELSGAIGIGAMAAAVALIGGAESDVAAGLWLVMAARVVAAVMFVRVQLLRAKGHRHRVLASDLGQAAAVTAMLIGFLLGVVPLAAVIAIGIVAVFGVILVRRRPVPAAVLGSQQVVIGLAVVLVTGLAVVAP